MNARTWSLASVLLMTTAALAPPLAVAQGALPSKPATTIDDFAWLAGHWRGKLESGAVAEISYSEPAGGLMMAMFRLMDSDRLLVLEYTTLRETPEGMEMRVRHFDPALTPWEKGEAITLKLTEHDGLRSVFENPVHTRPKRSTITLTSQNSHTVRSEILNDKGETSLIEVAWERVDVAATAPAPTAAKTAEASPASPLAPMARLIGNWRGQIRLLDGAVIEARNVFEWGLGGKTIQFRAYGLRDGTENLVYEGLYGWHPGEKKIVFREQSAFGSLVDGEVKPEGDTLVFSWRQHSAKGVVEYRETFRFPDNNSYVTEVYRKTENGWERFTLENPFAREAQEGASLEAWQRTIRKEVTVAAPLAEVWKAWTTTEGAKTFFAPEANIEAVVGGPYELYFAPSQPAGRRGSEGCKVHSVVPMKLLAFAWNAPPVIPALRNSGVHTVVYVELEEAGPEQTRVTMTHTGWGVGEDWDKAYQYFDRAWDAVLGNLRYRFAVGPVEWPGYFIRAEQPAPR